MEWNLKKIVENILYCVVMSTHILCDTQGSGMGHQEMKFNPLMIVENHLILLVPGTSVNSARLRFVEILEV